jgi:RES domain-containing protein
MDFSGYGAKISGGRWNSKGIPAIYASESVALCTAEIAVHIPLGMIPADFVLVTYKIPENAITSLRLSELPELWNSYPHAKATRNIGDHFLLSRESLVLQVPSAVVPQEFNFLINTDHKEISRMKILDVEPYNFDVRLFK